MHKTGAKVSETLQALHDGAQEIDMVIQVGALLDGEKDIVWNDIRSVTDTAHQAGALVKVIIETCLLDTDQKIMAAELVADAGADFIKTSTGFAGGGAIASDILLLRKHLPVDIGIKASGGITTYQSALEMIEAGAQRIGTSNGIHIINELKNTLA
jgi:deoxyribose-phosphate aldolase